jgi:hypothetical protein
MREGQPRAGACIGKLVLVAGAVLSLVLVAPAQAVAPGFCARGLGPLLVGGYNDVLRFFAEVGIRCRLDTGGSVVLGLRYTESRASALPWVSLSYVWPLGERLSLTVAAGLRERLGDWEGDRLPEATLWFSLPSGSPLRGAFGLSAGLFNVYGAQSGVLRAGARMNVSTPPVALGSLSAWLTGDAGHYAYGTGDGHTFLTWTANLRIPLSEAVSFQVAYVQADSSGTSPLRFDPVGLDRYWTANLQGSAAPAAGWRVGVLVDSTSGKGIREYQLALGIQSSSLNLSYRTSDQRVLVGFTVSP